MSAATSSRMTPRSTERRKAQRRSGPAGARQPNRPIQRRRDRRPQHRLGALLSGIDVVAGEDVAPAVLSRPFALITDSIAWAMLMDSGVHEDDAAWAARRTSERERTSLTAGRGWPWMVVRLSCPQNQIWKLMLADSVKK